MFYIICHNTHHNSLCVLCDDALDKVFDKLVRYLFVEDVTACEDISQDFKVYLIVPGIAGIIEEEGYVTKDGKINHDYCNLFTDVRNKVRTEVDIFIKDTPIFENIRRISPGEHTKEQKEILLNHSKKIFELFGNEVEKMKIFKNHKDMFKELLPVDAFYEIMRYHR